MCFYMDLNINASKQTLKCIMNIKQSVLLENALGEEKSTLFVDTLNFKRFNLLKKKTICSLNFTIHRKMNQQVEILKAL